MYGQQTAAGVLDVAGYWVPGIIDRTQNGNDNNDSTISKSPGQREWILRVVAFALMHTGTRNKSAFCGNVTRTD